MKKYVLLITVLNLYLWASVLDFVDIKKAENAYEAKDYQSASKFYSKIDNDEARYNQADTLYRQKKYKEALEVYKNIKDKKLKFKKLHNMGNSYANLNKIDEAIKSYEDALKIEQDKDTKYNLELLKKRKEDKKKKKDKDNKQNKENKNKQKQKDSDKSRDKNKKDSLDKDSKENKKQKSKESEDKKESKQKQAQKDKKREKVSKEGVKQTKQPPISNMEERKWQKMLNQRGINTLMIPLNSKGEQRDEKNPW